ncbi:Ski-like protein [Bagarius yarrelli]|uniref:Ski-like protein n=1 Tax=Bagarius yarrelli TaxID=175774 RepID=A0A556VXC5_BAGYA|nr:Ski-like protein [Bagarius yarrelli]
MMSMVQNNRPHSEKDQTLLRVPVKRLMRERQIEAAPIKKRVMAALNLSCKKALESPSSSRTPVIKTEHVEKDSEFFKYQHVSKGQDGRDSALDLSPALRHTLAQFTLSSQCSLGGPAAFSGQCSQEKLTPSLSQASVAVGPLLVPPDSSTELVLSSLEGESISCFSVGGVLPAGAPSCGLITLTDAQRLCNTLLHPGDGVPAGPHKDPRLAEDEEREAEEAGGFWVEHQCLGKCHGLFVPRLYTAPGAQCIRCSQCRRLFCPERFVMHSHRQPDKRTCHWGFDSAKWACYLQLGRRYQGTANEGKLEQLLEAMKLKFSGIRLDTKTSNPIGPESVFPPYAFDPCVLTNLKEDPRHLDLMWQSWYLYMHDKLSVSGVALDSARAADKHADAPTAETLKPVKKASEEAQEGERKASAGGKKTSRPASQSQRSDPDLRPRVSIETPACEKSLEENKDSMVVEVLQMYNAQQEKLRKQQEMELQALRKSDADELGEVQTEPQTEHAQKKEVERKRLQCSVEQQQSCQCREQQENRYSIQLLELRQRLDRAEEDREELQEELRREREAREKLERIITELRQQIKESVPPSTLDSPLSNSSAEQPKGCQVSQKKSPLELIIKQFRRKTEKKTASGSRLFPPSESRDRKSEGIPEETDGFVQKLGKTPESRNLSLSHCDLTATDMLEIGTLLPFLSQLEVLDLSWNELLGGSLKALTVHMQHVGKLKVLKLSGCRLTAGDLTALGETLDHVPMLEMLDLSWNAGIGGGHLHFLTERLHCTSSLRELHLLDCQLSETDSVALAEALLHLPSLEVLDLSSNTLQVEVIEKISSSLISTPHLKTLKMSRCGLNQESLTLLGETLRFLVGLEHLDVSCNKECGGGFGPVAFGLSFLTHLRCLDLHMCCLTEEDAQALVQVLPALSELSELDLSFNKSIGTLLQELFLDLPLSKMKTLHLSSCSLSVETWQTFGAVMPSLTQLQSLSVSWNKSVGGNLQQLVERLQVNCKLEELKMSSCHLTTDDLLHLQWACKRGALSNLKLLDVSYNGDVGDAGWVSLFRDAAAGLKQLQELDISLRPDVCVSASEWLSAMMDALPQLSALRRVCMQRWTLSCEERQKLEKSLKKSKVTLEQDDVTAQNVAG